MCDIKTKLKVKEMVGFKVVTFENGEFISPFYKAYLKLGSTKGLKQNSPNFNPPRQSLYNALVKSKHLVTAFKTKEGAVNLLKQSNSEKIIIRIKFGGSIYSGSGAGTCHNSEKFETIAGNVILEMTEIKL